MSGIGFPGIGDCFVLGGVVWEVYDVIYRNAGRPEGYMVVSGANLTNFFTREEVVRSAKPVPEPVLPPEEKGRSGVRGRVWKRQGLWQYAVWLGPNLVVSDNGGPYEEMQVSCRRAVAAFRLVCQNLGYRLRPTNWAAIVEEARKDI